MTPSTQRGPVDAAYDGEVTVLGSDWSWSGRVVLHPSAPGTYAASVTGTRSPRT